MSSRKLVDVLPAFAEEMRVSLIKEGREGLAGQLDSIDLVDRCRCGQDDCAMFYGDRPPRGPWGPEHENVVVSMEGSELVVLDVVNGQIKAVEVLDRDDVKAVIDDVVP